MMASSHLKALALLIALFALGFSVFSSIPAGAAYVTNYPETLKQPDGTLLRCFVSGDEFYHWLHDKNGYVIVMNAKGYYVYAIKAGEDLAPSAYVVGKVDPKKVGLTPNIRPSDRKLDARMMAMPERVQSPGRLKTPQTGTLNSLVIFIRFKDQSEFTTPFSTFSDYFNGTAGSSVRSFFQEASYNQLTINSTFYPTQSGVTVVSYKDTNNRSYYLPKDASNPGGYDGVTDMSNRERGLVTGAINAIASQVPADLIIDADSDGIVDNLFFLAQGGPDGDILWAHNAVWTASIATIRSKQVRMYDILGADLLATRGVGVICHEMGHSVGCPDLYRKHTAGTPIGPWDVMAYDQNPPQHFSTYLKWRCTHWVPSIREITASGVYQLSPMASARDNSYKIASPLSSTEYFILEYRKKLGIFENSLPGSGLTITRVNSAVSGGNGGGPPDEVYVYRPGGTLTADGDYSQAFFTSDAGRTAINDSTSPSCFLSGGTAGGINISQIGAAGNYITFRVDLLKMAAPLLSPSTSLAPHSVNVTVTSPVPTTTIRYTLNGADPSTSDPSVASGGTVVVDHTATLKVRAYRSGWTPSDVAAGSYRVQPSLFVDSSVTGSTHDGLSWATAFPTIQQAVDTAPVGMEVWVAKGFYSEQIQIPRPGIALYGGFAGWEMAKEQRDWVSNRTYIDGGGAGSVITVDHQDDSTNPVIINGFTLYGGLGKLDYGHRNGGGIYCNTSTVFTENNIITGCSADYGGAIHYSGISSGRITNNLIYGNTATQKGGGIYTGALSDLRVLNNTISDNVVTAGDGGAMYINQNASSSYIIRNNIMSFNGSGICVNYADYGPAYVIENNCLYGNTAYNYSGVAPGTNDIYTDPYFVNKAQANYHLLDHSTCIDRGTNTGCPSIDLEGRPRPLIGRLGTATCDIGAIEYRQLRVWAASPGPSLNGLTWASAYHSVQPAIAASVSGEEIWVARGTYVENLQLHNGVALYGGFSGTELERDDRNWLRNPTILDGGHVALVISTPTGAVPGTRIDGFTIRNGAGWSGGGICSGSGSVTITNNIITGNTAHDGGGIWCYGVISNSTISNNVIYGNTATNVSGGIHFQDSYALCINNTIADNTADQTGGVTFDNSGVLFYNNIVAFNAKGATMGMGVAGPGLYNNCFYHNAGNYHGVNPGPGDLLLDPLFRDQAAHDYHLAAGSPCIDAATDYAAPSLDRDLRHRPFDGDQNGSAQWDIGAYEFRRRYVKKDAPGAQDGNSWSSAGHYLQDVLNPNFVSMAAIPPDEVWVAAGTYDSITLLDGVSVYGGFAGTETSRAQRSFKTNVTILDGANAYTVVTTPPGASPGTRLDGFTLQNGSAINGGGLYCGAGYPTIVNNVIKLNAASGGAAAYFAGSNATFANNLVTNNTVAKGGGILGCAGGQPWIINNTIAANVSPLADTVRCSDSAALIGNNIIAFNDAGVHAIGSILPSLVDNCVYSNTAYNYLGIAAGSGDFSSDPRFASTKTRIDYHILSSSPCIDAGSNTLVDPGAVDMDGEQRILGDRVDVGADECTVTYYTSSGFIQNGRWNLVSLPADPAIPDPLVVFNRVDVPNASFQYWRNDIGGYQLYGSTFGWTGPVQRGVGYWMIEMTPGANKDISFKGAPPSAEFDLTIPAHAGAPFWVAFGTPFPAAVPATSLRFQNLAMRGEAWLGWEEAYSAANSAERIVDSNALGWDAANMCFASVTVPAFYGMSNQFEPWWGYWMLVYDPNELTIRFPRPY